jgi:hypothetical protein
MRCPRFQPEGRNPAHTSSAFAAGEVVSEVKGCSRLGLLQQLGQPIAHLVQAQAQLGELPDAG